jgi:hypothetical protein
MRKNCFFHQRGVTQPKFQQVGNICTGHLISVLLASRAEVRVPLLLLSCCNLLLLKKHFQLNYSIF